MYELLNAVEVLDNLDGIRPKPDNERQLNELAKLRIEGTHQYDTTAERAGRGGLCGVCGERAGVMFRAGSYQDLHCQA